MAYRFTNTDKWKDVWFSNLKQLEMLLFLYLCDNCDIAGFIEINYKRWASDLGSSIDTIKGACKGLARGLLFSNCGECLYIRNFLKHQKNYPLNEKNKAHYGIIKRFELLGYKFDIQDINTFIEGASKGLQSPTGNGIGNSIDISTKITYIDKAKEFYKNELEYSKNDSKYDYFINYLFGANEHKKPLSRILKLEDQLTFESFSKLMNICTDNKLKLLEITLDLENYTGGKYKTVSGALNTFIQTKINRNGHGNRK